MNPKSRTNRCSFTISNCSDKEEQRLSEFASLSDTIYLVYCRKIGKFGRKLVKGFFITHIRHEWSYYGSISCFSRATLDVTKGSNKKVSDQCKKYGNYEEFGHLPFDDTRKEQRSDRETSESDVSGNESSTESKDPREPICDYEKIRAMNIERNNARLRSLGLLKEPNETPKLKRMKLKANTQNHVPRKTIRTRANKDITRNSELVQRHVGLQQSSVDDGIWV